MPQNIVLSLFPSTESQGESTMFYDAILAISLPLIGFGVLASIYGILAYLFNWE